MPGSWGFSEDDFHKLYAVKALHTFSRALYLSPNILVLEKLDDVFCTQFTYFQFLLHDPDASIYLFEPSFEQYKTLIAGAEKANETSFKIFLESWTKNQFKQVEFMPKRLGTILENGQTKWGDQLRVPLVNLKDYPSESNLNSWNRFGWFGDCLMAYWLHIQRDCVLPLISSFNSVTRNNIEICKHHKYKTEPIAIVGMSCRYPGSNDLLEFWDLLFQGRDGTSSAPSFRWLKGQSNRSVRNPDKTNAGFLKISLDEFDAKFFGKLKQIFFILKTVF